MIVLGSISKLLWIPGLGVRFGGFWLAVWVGALSVLAESFSPVDRSRGEAEDESTVIAESLREHVERMFETMSPEARAGYRVLVDNAYLPADFSELVVERLAEQGWKSPFVDAVANDPRHAAWQAFGISPRPDDEGLPLQYVMNDSGEYIMNCFACHGGNTYGVSFPGAPNTTYLLESLTENVRRIKLREKLPLAHMDVGSAFMPLGTTIGTSNAVMFGVALMGFRDRDLNVVTRAPAAMVHHDMDAPPWWHFSRKTHMYIDGFAEKGHKGLMQFMLVRQNGPEKFRRWAKDFANVYQFISEIEPPSYPLEIDLGLARQGEKLFKANCASCHGTYGADGEYPEINIPIDEIGTDRVRWDSLTPAHRAHYGDSWFADYGGQNTIDAPEGYTAPPLDGIWATAPYLHNGSVPTLWHLFYPEERPVVWRRSQLGFDSKKVGLSVEEFTEVPKGLSSYERRLYFDTRQTGKGAAGHRYPEVLSEEEKLAVIEYLKTL